MSIPYIQIYFQNSVEFKSSRSRRKFFKKWKDFKKPEGKDVKKSESICYECKKPGHIKTDCPKLKKAEFKKKDNSKKKAMTAAWNNESDSDSESSSSDEEEEKANMAFIANTNKQSFKLPPTGRFKLNVDGALKHSSGIAAGGGILRNDRGDLTRLRMLWLPLVAPLLNLVISCFPGPIFLLLLRDPVVWIRQGFLP
ncbi:hypothetical protein Taro_024670 [Colocasia esculenta]|uniref:CCHC-type domain-containing protein n=1 Tax=Colocasia esculenta TaxID=4460 RepID=A0A843V7E5_COLES|nr:hypothetical protein [Colocasia esculenta]